MTAFNVVVYVSISTNWGRHSARSRNIERIAFLGFAQLEVFSAGGWRKIFAKTNQHCGQFLAALMLGWACNNNDLAECDLCERFILVVLFVCFALYFSFLFTFYVLVFSASTIIAMKKSPRIKSESYCENLDLIDCGQIVNDG